MARPIVLAVLLALALSPPAKAQQVVSQSPDRFWALLDRMPAEVTTAQPWIRTERFAPVQLDFDAYGAALAKAPPESAPSAAYMVIWLPMPDGRFARFAIFDAPVMEAPLAAQLPQIRTYAGQGMDDPAATVRLDHTPLGFHAQVLAPSGAVYIDPYSRGDTAHYSVYFKRDYTGQPDGWVCHTPPGDLRTRSIRAGGGNTDTPTGTTLRTYRLANACTGEYAAFFGGTVPNAQAAIVTAVNRVTGVYEVDMAIRMTLVANNTSIVYTNAAGDPYTNNSGGTMLSQNQSACDSVIGSANYDIGHVFSTGGGGIAGLGVVGRAGFKAQGVTGLGSPTGDPFYIDYVAHEMGHQFGANHCFNSQTGSCGGGNRSGSNAYEPGSASTIMGYAGICGTDDLQPHSDPYFLWDSHDDIMAYLTGTVPGVGVQTSTGNTIPTINGGTDFTIPASTPFTLTAAGSDPNGDTLTYCWEQADLGVATTVSTPDNGSSPIIRSFNPSLSPARTIPRLSNLLANTFAVGEMLPATNRTLHFVVSVRDNRVNGGGWNSDTVNVTSVNTGAAFQVTSPNTAVSWAAGPQTVTWNVAGTTASPINAANVAVLLSTDGGSTFPTTLLASTPNTGSASVTIPSSPTSFARIKVAAVGNVFFDISNTNFTITGPAGPPNNNCSSATSIGLGSTPFTTVNATTDGPAEGGCGFCCGDSQINQDVWFRYDAACSGRATASLCGASFDTKVAIYIGPCPSGPGAIACNDDSDACAIGSLQSSVTWTASSGTSYLIRVGGFTTATGTGTLSLSCAPCYPNCDGSPIEPILNVADFTCFLQRFAANDPYANCDGSVIPPVLNVADFTCFLQSFAAGCP